MLYKNLVELLLIVRNAHEAKLFAVDIEFILGPIFAHIDDLHLFGVRRLLVSFVELIQNWGKVPTIPAVLRTKVEEHNFNIFGDGLLNRQKIAS